jgi:hypothetical protein
MRCQRMPGDRSGFNAAGTPTDLWLRQVPPCLTLALTQYHKFMKTLLYIITILGVASLTLVHAQMRADMDKDIPLAEAILQANEQFPDVQPLTEEEVIAAVRAIKLEFPDIKESVYQIYQRVVNERVLPKGMYFSHIPAWHTKYGHFEVDWKDLTLDSVHAGIKGEKPGYGFNYRIRARFISSRPLTEAEAKEMRERAKMVEPGGATNR